MDLLGSGNHLLVHEANELLSNVFEHLVFEAVVPEPLLRGLLSQRNVGFDGGVLLDEAGDIRGQDRLRQIARQ